MIKLAEISCDAPEYLDKEEAREQTREWVERLGELQAVMYAEQKHSVLIVLQGMDASGKDGAVRRVFAECNPVGLEVTAFKKPTEKEFAHDFLWRVHKHTPPKGKIGIFVRSHYEDVLIQRVHNWIDEEHAMKRIQAINAFESLLQFDNNTHIFKFYLHISKEQQEEELRERLEEHDKFWKHNSNDWKERDHWDEYMRCYEEAINASAIPWHIVPVDQRWYRNYVMSKILVENLEKLNMQYPPLNKYL